MQHKVKELLDFDQESDSDSDSDNGPIVKKESSPVAKKRGRKSAAFIRGEYKSSFRCMFNCLKMFLFATHIYFFM